MKKWIPATERSPALGTGSDDYKTIKINPFTDSVFIGDTWYSNDPLYPEDAGWDESNGWIVLAWMESEETDEKDTDTV